jgi:hypothetical protein
MNYLFTSIDFGFKVETSVWDIFENNGKTYIVPAVITAINNGEKKITHEYRIPFLLSETEPDPAGRLEHLFHRAGLSLKDSILVEL